MKPASHLLSALALTALASLGTQAQTVYRIVGPDGKVTFSDKPPVADQGKVTSTGTGARASAANANLPFELKQAVSKYPVSLYTSAKCAPCDAGRNLLNGRGIPFTERTISTAEDTEYLQRLAGEANLPLLTVGGQKVKGFSDAEWNRYLDAAGYPATSLLPSGYKNPAPAPAVAVKPKEDPKPVEKAPVEPPPPPLAPTGPTPTNPAGITF
ncbi:glutaredoxin family protein [Curvibacter sp. APW13]|uniref:glutaredoxin family protein n=1 Tax=Curvibacter sp. APW13 TaxID=3077236 RepID=UPI0028DEBE4B|nr:glutaredoxin family protein [Curvibacter sp. APW13]MDT8991483.1 glutaredoxin family protein [Curvibacter sp. APW13]